MSPMPEPDSELRSEFGRIMEDAVIARILAKRWRPEVVAFADAMEERLRANDHKGGWKNDIPWALYRRMQDEMSELAGALDSDDRAGSVVAADVLHEAADVANFAMMVADSCGALHGRPPQESAK